MDVTASAEVWNQPIYSYSILNSQYISSQQAASVVSQQAQSYTWNTAAVGFLYVQTEMKYVSEGIDFVAISTPERIQTYLKTKTYTYVLELDASNNIVGGEWAGESKADHPDFIWMPVGKPDPDSEVAGIKYSVVKQLLTESATRC